MFFGLKTRQMKAHFDTPGAPQVESLNNLAAGMNRKGAALLFYQTCGTHPYILLPLPTSYYCAYS